MKNFQKYIKKYRKRFSIAILFLSLETLADLFQPLLMARIVDQGIVNGNLDVIFHIGATMLGVTLFGALAACIRSIMASRVSQDFGAELRFDLFHKIQSLPFASIDRHQRGSLITRLTNDITQVQNFINGTMRIFVKAPLIFLGAIIMSISLNGELALVILTIVPLAAVMIAISVRKIFPQFGKMQVALDGVNNRMRDYLGGVRVVKAFNRWQFENERFQAQSKELAEVSIVAMRWMSLLHPIITFLLNIGLVLILWFGGMLVARQGKPIGEVIAFTAYMTQIAGTLTMITMVFIMFVRAKASTERISEVFTDDTCYHEKDMEKIEGIMDHIIFEDVSFSYFQDSENFTLKNMNFEIKIGQSVGIIGATGSGKSTLVNLLLRFYDLGKGRILIDNTTITTIHPKILRDHIAIVPQKSLLFTGTILENIRFGCADATLDEIRHVAKIANIDDYIMSLPEGYDAVVGQGGVNFSGGQKQRLAIARALIKKPSVLILDDSLSAVDAHTEASIKANLVAELTGITVITIAQKISTVASCDQILVLEHGELQAQGTHDRLMASSNVYQEIFASQIRGGKGYEPR